MGVRDLNIDLIDSINPFGAAYAVLAKSMNPAGLKQVQAVISAKKIRISPEEARELAERALRFKKERGRLPEFTAPDAWRSGLPRASPPSRAIARRRLPMADLSDDELLSELGVAIEPAKARSHTPREERIIAGFEDIVRFYEQHDRAPQHGEDRDIFERLYAVRLDRLRGLKEARDVLASIDTHGLLAEPPFDDVQTDAIDDSALLAELGVEPDGGDDIRVLRHVPSAEDRRAAEAIANRETCADFGKFEPLFEQVQAELDSGKRTTRPIELKAEIRPGALFIVGGQIAYVAEMDDVFTNAQGRSDARLRVVFDNGTQSKLLMRSLQRALNKDEAGRRITDPQAGPLFSGEAADGDDASGTIYVLRSKSDHPLVAQHRDLVHKIGVTNMPVEQRIAGARLQPTFLMADVEILAQYQLFNINRTRLERLIHRVFGAAQIDLSVPDRFGNPTRPREWFLVPISVIDEAVQRIKDGSITRFQYDPKEARLVERK